MTLTHPITVSSWTLGDQCKFEDRVKAAAKAGYDGIGLRAETYVDALNEGLTDQGILAILDQYHIKCTEVEYIVQWCEEPRTYEQKYKEQTCFHMCHLFGVEHINTGLMESYPVDFTAKKLQELAHRAALAGNLIIALEPMPYSGMPDLKKTWAILQGAGAPNVMMLLDMWHWVRADQPFDLLTKEQAKRVISIQLDDAYKRPYAKSILRDESMHDRLAPGTGFEDRTEKFIKMIKEAGVDPKVIGVEVISDHYMAKGIDWVAKYTYDTTVKTLQAAWPEILKETVAAH
ncbi:sugar phosphate isomerase/epimerase [Lacticaseibacillus paracasei]|jgi:sugar phosphate isomerase/epimerase|uniref:Sugar phosphate isomerase/epimerase n=2 Tax=Lacticaseibacillus paracasei subsp. paracasei TaxID=47714 RepID=A0A829H750_LACPA|nr:sugar phosphate isomerase/epimerase [Lacticaseibacillus paracasei]EKQ23917.1 inosose isomerase [Lacticaseibacillus casei UW4]EPC29519.1 sugar phosphate isomerase/epimerase [Lacticaseibacillus paracasei subsp. paracasei Lpp22]EPC73682.1 sugar phosphate isomerase/epimerase [Lacticaseibacillus paracasei subsp. paracasei Lpp41]OJF74471.1 AP endonuclease [Lacticaseibacillus casei]ATG97975.1 AP endonuclease [Lacticaseibacillus paracasei]